MSFNKKVVKLLKEKKKSKAELAKAAGIPYTTLDSMLKRESDTGRLATIYKIAEYLGVSVEELVFDDSTYSGTSESFTDEEKNLIADYRKIDERGKKAVVAALSHELSYMSRYEFKPKEHKNTRMILVYNAPAAAGEALPIIADDYDMVEANDAPLDASFGIKISGDSMEPEISDGSTVWVKKQENISQGEIGIFLLNGESLCKKYDFSDGICKLISINKKYHPIEVLESDDLRVVGRVLLH
jgi:SOS-response transcriptional repressor LexA